MAQTSASLVFRKVLKLPIFFSIVHYLTCLALKNYYCHCKPLLCSALPPTLNIYGSIRACLFGSRLRLSRLCPDLATAESVHLRVNTLLALKSAVCTFFARAPFRMFRMRHIYTLWDKWGPRFVLKPRGVAVCPLRSAMGSAASFL